MLPSQLKSLIEEYCMGIQPTDAQIDEIMDMAISLSADSNEVAQYMEEMQNGSTKEEKDITYSITIADVTNILQASMTARALFNWSTAKTKENIANVPIDVLTTKLRDEAMDVLQKLNNGGFVADIFAVNALGEIVDINDVQESSSKEGTKEINNNNHEFVDLGLSVKWATCDLGASKPDEVGDLFAWGEVKTKDEFTDDNYKWYRRGEEDEEYIMATKYNSNSQWGDVDNITRLELEDDAARVNWGGDWRIPTEDEFWELINNCTFEVLFTGRIIEINGDISNWDEYYKEEIDKLYEARIKITSKKNGNSIYMYAPMTAGYGWLRYSTSDTNYSDDSCDQPTILCHSLSFGDYCGDTILENELEITDCRDLGFRIRPVIK